MGLAAAQIRLLSLTERKADIEYGISIDSMHKMSLTREMSELSQEYYSRLQAKNVAYYANGKYNKMDYAYLMGDGMYTSVLNNSRPMKEQKSMVLADYKGQVVLSDTYARAITAVLGTSAMDNNGRGGTFSPSNIAAILAELCPGLEKEKFQNVINEKELESSFDANTVNTLTGQETGDSVEVDNSDAEYDLYKGIMDESKGHITLFISHRLSSVKDADEVFMLENGAVIEQGTHRQLMDMGGKYCEMFTKQAQNYLADETYREGVTA